MNANMRAIDLNQLREIVSDLPGVETIIEYARLADPLFVGEICGIHIVIVAFIPMTLLSDTAYTWVQVLPEGAHYKHAIARLFLRWKPIVHTRYTKLVAHCSTSPEHRAWIHFTKAKKISEVASVIEFTMEPN